MAFGKFSPEINFFKMFAIKIKKKKVISKPRQDNFTRGKSGQPYSNLRRSDCPESPRKQLPISLPIDFGEFQRSIKLPPNTTFSLYSIGSPPNLRNIHDFFLRWDHDDIQWRHPSIGIVILFFCPNQEMLFSRSWSVFLVVFFFERLRVVSTYLACVSTRDFNCWLVQICCFHLDFSYISEKRF